MVETGQRYEIEITDLSSDGRGIGRAEGITLFVAGALPGDRVLAEVTGLKKSFAEARTAELLEPSEWRVESPCPYGAVCGGCPLMGLSYQGQLALKKKWVVDRLRRIGGVENPPVEDVIGMEEPWRYRNKAVYAVGRAGGQAKKDRGCNVGFYRAGSRELLNVQHCLIQTEAAERLAEALRQYVKENKVPVYDEKTGTGLLGQLTVRTAFGTGDVMAVLGTADRRIPGLENLAEGMNRGLDALNEKIARSLETQAAGEEGGREGIEDEDYGYYLESLIACVDRGKGKGGKGVGNAAAGSRNCVTLAGKPVIADYACGMELEISPLSFYQVNPVQMEALYNKVAEYAALTGKETVWDLYCGVGTIGLSLAGQAARVVGVESVKAAVLDANRNATLNGIVNAEFICGKAEEVLAQLGVAAPGTDVPATPGADVPAASETDVPATPVPEAAEHDTQTQETPAKENRAAVLLKDRPELIILDPPRAGCHPALLSAVTKAGPPRIIYVSCDPATLARDVKTLTAAGYHLQKAQPVDMFPHTSSIECVALFTKSGAMR